MSAPLQPILYSEFDVQVQQVSANVLELAGFMTSAVNWALGILTQANADAGLILGPDHTVQPGGQTITGYQPMTPEMLAHYQDIYSKLKYVSDLLAVGQGANPAAIDIVRAWSRQGSGMPQGMTMPGQQMGAMRRY